MNNVASQGEDTLVIRAELCVFDEVIVALQDRKQFAGRCLPDPRGLVPRGCNDAPAVGTEPSPHNRGAMPLKGCQQPAGFCLPNLAEVCRCSRNSLPIGT